MRSLLGGIVGESRARVGQSFHVSQMPPGWIDEFSGWETAAGVRIGTDNALEINAVYACVRVLAETVAQIPLILYRRRTDGRGKDRAMEHPLYRLLHDLPNPEMSAFEFRETLMGHLATWGNAYAEIEWLRNGSVGALWPLRPDRMERVAREQDDLVYYYRLPSEGVKAFAAERILHVRGLSFDGRIGYTPIQLQRQTLALGMAAQEYGARFFANDARPGGVLEHPGQLSDTAHKRLLASWEKRHQPLENKHRLAILEEGMKFHEIGLPPEDAQFLQTRRLSIEDVARIYRVPPHMIQDLERATFCLPAGELVETETGPRPIEEIRSSDLVWSVDDAGHIVLAPVIAFGPTGEDAILTLRTTNRELRCNAKHPILTRRKRYVDVLGGRGGAYIHGKPQHVEWVTEYVPAGQLAVGDVIVTLDRLPCFGDLRACPTRAPSIGFMEFCGLLLSDGNLIRGSSHYVTIAHAGHAPYMDHYRDVIAREFVSFGNHGNGRGRHFETQPVHLQEGDRQIRFSSVLAVEELAALGLSGDAHSKRIPEWVFGLPEDFRLAFVRGYLDGDGFVDKKGRISFGSVNETMLRQLRHLCIGCGIPVTNIRNQRGVTRLPNGRQTPFSLWTFTCSDPGANRRIGSHTPIYNARIASGKPFGRKNRDCPRYGGEGFAASGLSLSRIVKIETGASETVYDVTVAGTHSFIASGVVVHNSNIEHQSIDFVTYTMGPWFARWEQAVYRSLLLPSERPQLFAEFLIDALLRGDTTSRYQAYSIGRQNGWLSANDIRERENLNPIDNGDVYLVPLNMIPADSVSALRLPAGAESAERQSRGEQRGGGTPPELRSLASATLRHRLMQANMRLYQDVAARVLRREANDIGNQARKLLQHRDMPSFRLWLDEFYREHTDFVSRQFSPLANSYGQSIAAAAREEIGEPGEMTEQLEQFIAAYVEAFAARHSTVSKSRILNAIQRALDDGNLDPLTEIEAEISAWEEQRSQETALWEAVRFGNAVSRAAYLFGGILRLRWVAFGESCPYCSALNGRIVGIQEAFIPAGSDFQPEGAERPLHTTHHVGHAPAHVGCDCMIAAA